VADQDFVDVGGVDAGTLERGTNGHRPELGRMQIAEGAAIAPDGGARGAKDDHVAVGHRRR
jgi:hypothetical protein